VPAKKKKKRAHAIKVRRGGNQQSRQNKKRGRKSATIVKIHSDKEGKGNHNSNKGTINEKERYALYWPSKKEEKVKIKGQPPRIEKKYINEERGWHKIKRILGLTITASNVMVLGGGSLLWFVGTRKRLDGGFDP